MISGTGHQQTSNNRASTLLLGDTGISLVEVMVVVLIMGLLATVVSLSLPAVIQSPTAQAEKISARLNHAARRAVLKAETIALVANESQYGFKIPSTAPGGWSMITWPDGVQIEDWNARHVNSKDRGTRTLNTPTADSPALYYFTPTGDNGPLALYLPDIDMTLSTNGTDPFRLGESSQ